MPSSDLRLGPQLERRERHLGGEPLAQRRRQVGHLPVVARPARDPLPDLRGAIGGLARLGERALEQDAVHRAECRRGAGWDASRFASRMSEQADEPSALWRCTGRGPLLLNPGTAGSAKLLASLGFEALATTSSGFAGDARPARRVGDARGGARQRRGDRRGDRPAGLGRPRERLRRRPGRGRLDDPARARRVWRAARSRTTAPESRSRDRTRRGDESRQRPRSRMRPSTWSSPRGREPPSGVAASPTRSAAGLPGRRCRRPSLPDRPAGDIRLVDCRRSRSTCLQRPAALGGRAGGGRRRSVSLAGLPLRNWRSVTERAEPIEGAYGYLERSRRPDSCPPSL